MYLCTRFQGKERYFERGAEIEGSASTLKQMKRGIACEVDIIEG